jgi:hypothetical protein
MPPSFPPADFPQKGQVSEWSKELAWKACVGVTLPWVRIPPCPPLKGPNPMRSMGWGLSISADRMRTTVRFEASRRRAKKDGAKQSQSHPARRAVSAIERPQPNAKHGLGPFNFSGSDENRGSIRSEPKASGERRREAKSIPPRPPRGNWPTPPFITPLFFSPGRATPRRGSPIRARSSGCSSRHSSGSFHSGSPRW